MRRIVVVLLIIFLFIIIDFFVIANKNNSLDKDYDLIKEELLNSGNYSNINSIHYYLGSTKYIVISDEFNYYILMPDYSLVDSINKEEVIENKLILGYENGIFILLEKINNDDVLYYNYYDVKTLKLIDSIRLGE